MSILDKQWHPNEIENNAEDALGQLFQSNDYDLSLLDSIINKKPESTYDVFMSEIAERVKNKLCQTKNNQATNS